MSLSQAFLAKLHPRNWNWKTYLAVGLFLLGVNLFGPRGAIHWMVVHQQSERLTQLNEESAQKIKVLENEISDFKKYSYQQQKAIREELGYLRPDEYSLEFVEAQPNENHTPGR